MTKSKTYSTRIVGTTFEGRQENLNNFNSMIHSVEIKRQPENPYDGNAILVLLVEPNGDWMEAGYINRHLAAKLTPQIDSGCEMKILDFQVTGNYQKNTLGMVLEYVIIDKEGNIIEAPKEDK